MKRLNILALGMCTVLSAMPIHAEQTTIFVQNESNATLLLKAINLMETVPAHSRKDAVSVVNHAYIASYPNGTYACSWFINKVNHGQVIDGIVYRHAPGTKPVCSYVTHQN